MNKKEFIKVTPKGGTAGYVVPAVNHQFYLSQGAEITAPTEEEIYKAYPELAEKQRKAVKSSELDAVKDTIIVGLKKKIEELTAANNELHKVNNALMADKKQWEEKLETLKAEKKDLDDAITGMTPTKKPRTASKAKKSEKK